MLLDVAESKNPSFLTLSPDKRTLYAVYESGKPTDAVTAFSFDKESGKLKEINQETVNGTAPCYVATNGKYVLTANYGSGSITVLPTGSNGKLLPAVQAEQFTLTGEAPDKARQNGPHLHCVKLSPDSTFFVAADLGCMYTPFPTTRKSRYSRLNPYNSPLAAVRDTSPSPKMAATHIC